MKTFFLDTDRLFLRPHQYDDVNFMIDLNSDFEVTRYTGDGPVDETLAREIVSKLTGQFDERRIGRFIAIEKKSGEKVGWSGLAHLKERDVIDLGFRFLRVKWGMGYATEAARACLRYGFESLAFPEITARVDGLNSASLNVLKKLGMTSSELSRDEEGEYYDFKILKDDFLRYSTRL